MKISNGVLPPKAYYADPPVARDSFGARRVELSETGPLAKDSGLGLLPSVSGNLASLKFKPNLRKQEPAAVGLDHPALSV